MPACPTPRLLSLAAALALASGAAAATDEGAAGVAEVASPAPTTASVLAATAPEDWRRPDPGQLIYVELEGGRVVIELAEAFAPAHVANIRALARAGWYDHATINRVQDNYVVQWGRSDEDAATRGRGGAQSRLAAEFDRDAAGLAFTVLEDGDVYASQVGWVDGFPAARDTAQGRAWLAHCYGMVGAGRGNPADSSDGGELYVVIGHAPRHLDRNITTVGRVLAGVEHLSALPRGTGTMGFYEDPAQRIALRGVRVAADVPEAERTALEVLRTDSAAFTQLVAARRERREGWFIDPVGHVELCNVPLPVRAAEP